jgi:hypothetical protein
MMSCVLVGFRGRSLRCHHVAANQGRQDRCNEHHRSHRNLLVDFESRTAEGFCNPDAGPADSPFNTVERLP